MLTFEVINELTLKVTCRGSDVLFTKAGSFICGENGGQKNYKFEKLLLGPQQSVGQALLGSLMRRVTGENLPLMKVMMNGDSVTYYANRAQHVVVYQLQPGEVLSIESENILAFTPDCKYDVRFIGCGVISQKGLATSTLTGEGPNAYVAILIDGNPIVLSNIQTGTTLAVDPDAVVCWMGNGYCDPDVKMDVNWKTFIGQASGESYSFEWNPPPACDGHHPAKRACERHQFWHGRRQSRAQTELKRWKKENDLTAKRTAGMQTALPHTVRKRKPLCGRAEKEPSSSARHAGNHLISLQFFEITSRTVLSTASA